MRPRLICLDGVKQGEVTAIGRHELSVGRGASNDLTLADPGVSRHHCTLRQSESSQIEIVDHGSRNGTFVNGIPVNSRLLEHEDRIRIGSSEFLFVLAEEEEAPPPSVILRQSPLLDTRTVIHLRPEDSAYLQAAQIPGSAAAPGRTARHLQALLRLTGLIRAKEGMEALARGIMEVLFDTVPASYGALLLLEPESAEPGWSYGWRRESGPSMDVEVSSDLAREAAGQDVGILSKLPAEEDPEGRPRSILVAPLSGKDKPAGVVFLAGVSPPEAFDQEHLELVTAVGRIAGLVLEDARTLHQLRTENRRLRQEMDLDHGMVGESPPMQRVCRFIAKVAPADSTVLITGESGTGKELVARAVHRSSRRAEGPFVAINCAALTATLLESELFGHEKGAFTGALGQKPGKFELANGGTIFLDEVGELSAELQAKLLRVLQEREFERVGGTRPIRADVRVIAATNRDLPELIRGQGFREDLYYRLNVVSLRMPPLRERPDDIPLLTNYFLSRFAARMGRRIQGVSPEARRLMAGYDWPGNVRELENAVERAVVLGNSPSILPEDLPDALLEQLAPAGAANSGESGYLDAVHTAKQQIILRALAAAHGNQMKAAAALGVHHTYLSRLIRGLGLKDKVAHLRGS